MVKHINTTREDASWVDDYGIVHYWPGENTTTTYYVHSTVLSGRTIAEVNSNGTIGDTFVYAGSARIATDHHFTGGSYSEIELSNPVTGASFTTDASGSYSTRKEPDPIGRDLTDPIAPLSPDPFSSNLFLKDRTMPIEYTGGPSDEFGIPNWYVNMAMADWDMSLAQGYHQIKRDDLAQQILAHNPNVGIIASGRGVGPLAEYTGGHVDRSNDTLTLWGAEAYNWGQAFDSAIFEFDLMLLQALPALVNSVGLIV